MERYYNDISNNNNNPDRKKTAMKPKISGRFIATIALPAVLLVLTSISVAPTNPVQATGAGGNETAATLAPSGTSLGPTASGTNVTTTTADMQSDCLSQNTTTTGRPAVDTGAATTTNNTTTTTVAPGGASIGGNDTSTSLAGAGNTTTATVAPGGASIC